MAKVTFNGIDKLIIMNQNIMEIDVGVDIYSEWKRWIRLNDNAKFMSAFNVIGGDNITETKRLGTTFFLINGWKIRPFEGDHTLRIIGNLYCDDGTLPCINTIGRYNVSVQTMVSNLVDTIVIKDTSGSSVTDYAKSFDCIYIDVNSTMTGTEYPVGMKEYPVNNMRDALIIRNSTGVDKMHLLSDITISQNLDDVHIEGGYKKITLNNAMLTNTEFTKCVVTGSTSGESVYTNCTIENYSTQNATITGCKLIGDFKFSGTYLDVMTSYSPSFNEYVRLYIESTSDANINFISFSGTMIIKHSNRNHLINMHYGSGSLIVDSDCTSGTIDISGIVNPINYSNLAISTDNIITPKNINNNLINYDLAKITDSTGNTLGGYIKYKLLTIFRYIGLK